MPEYPTNPALEAAVIANAEDDTPRLVYADWLDEHGDPDRAAFIRTQCALWDKNPADEDYVALIERYLELQSLIRMHPRRSTLRPVLPSSLVFHDSSLDGRDDSAAATHRGFPYFAQEPSAHGGQQNAAQAARLRDSLPEVFHTTTIRGLNIQSHIRHVATVLESTAISQLSALALHDFEYSSSMATDTVVNSAARTSLRWLAFSRFHPSSDVKPLLSAQLPQLRRLDAYWWAFSPAHGRAIMATQWFGELHRLCLGIAPESCSVVETLGALPNLHTLETYRFPTEAVRFFPLAFEFRTLSRLFLQSDLRGDAAIALAKAHMPNLRSLELRGCLLRNDEVKLLTASPLFDRLTVLALGENKIGDNGIKAIARSPAAQTLQRLRLSNNNFGKSGLAALCKLGAFPRLTTLDLSSATKRKASAADVSLFLQTLTMPNLRHLNLQGWPIGDAGAEVLARNSSFASLTRLTLGRCGIGRSGLRALASSPYLRNLIYLNISDNPCEDQPQALLDVDVFPNLAECWLGGYNKSMRKPLEVARPSVSWV
jgi:uncharacterized protein (TIGR02996 family)